MRRVKVIENQNIMDVAVQEYGNRLAVFQILTDNPNILNADGSDIFSLEKDLLIGQSVNIQTTGDLLIKPVIPSLIL